MSLIVERDNWEKIEKYEIYSKDIEESVQILSCINLLSVN
jgi:hypothetical protein